MIKNEIMKKICSIISLCYMLISCKSETVNNYEISYQKPIIIIDTLFMRMPGTVYYINNNLIIEDPLSKENFYNVYNSSGDFIKNIAPVGNSSTEFISPNFTLLANEDIIISDMNRGNAVIYKNGFDTMSKYNDLGSKLLKKYPLINIDNDIFLTINNSYKKKFKNDKNNQDEKLFNVYKKDSLISSFGEFPIKKRIDNKFEVCQGFLGYNKNNKILVFFSYAIPYYAIYKNNNNNFELIKEETYAKFDYTLTDNILRITDIEKPINTDIALIKDYIVTVGNTEEDLKHIPVGNGSGTDFTQLPRSLFIYDYDYNLIKVISLETPTFRVTSNINSNELHFINYIDGEFNLSKINIE